MESRQFRGHGGQVVLTAPRDGVAQILLDGLARLPNVELVES